MTAQGENFFCRALAASANVRLAAAAAGFTHSAFYQKKRRRPAFAREWGISLEIGFDRLEWALSASMEAGLDPFARGDYAQRDYGDAPLPPMTVGQAIQQVSFHRRACRLEGAFAGRRARSEPAIETVRDEVLFKLSALRRARRYEETGSWRFAHEQSPPPLPPLHQVTGWSKADPARSGRPSDLAWFGGWRIGDLGRRRARSA
jgi:hypothetical protein